MIIYKNIGGSPPVSHQEVVMDDIIGMLEVVEEESGLTSLDPDLRQLMDRFFRRLSESEEEGYDVIRARARKSIARGRMRLILKEQTSVCAQIRARKYEERICDLGVDGCIGCDYGNDMHKHVTATEVVAIVRVRSLRDIERLSCLHETQNEQNYRLTVHFC
ncbi:MAG TPA: hypothetical protein VLE99_00005 [Candidatus Saccharimonadales bacterium]|nr:hypothetical protein [Candidatus Saccharimonadales bacterium]